MHIAYVVGDDLTGKQGKEQKLQIANHLPRLRINLHQCNSQTNRMKMWGVTAAGVQGLLAEPRKSHWLPRASTSRSRNRLIGAVHRHK